MIMLLDRPLTFSTLFKVFWVRIGVTWLLTLVETTLLALIPLFTGFAIDGLGTGSPTSLWHLCSLLVALVAVAVLRRVYDTRAYGTIRVELGDALARRSTTLPISSLNARVQMARELVDFLEDEVPRLLTAFVQLLVALIVLSAYHLALGSAALLAGLIMIAIYAHFHRHFFRLNRALNARSEKQVRLLESRNTPAFLRHLTLLRHW